MCCMRIDGGTWYKAASGAASKKWGHVKFSLAAWPHVVMTKPPPAIPANSSTRNSGHRQQPEPKMTRFRPCIDLHAGEVKQIVGGTLDSTSEALKTNYVSKLPASHYACMYKENALTGGHVIMLGPGNSEAATDALQAWPGGLQLGGGISNLNARNWIDAGAEKVRDMFAGWQHMS